MTQESTCGWKEGYRVPPPRHQINKRSNMTVCHYWSAFYDLKKYINLTYFSKLFVVDIVCRFFFFFLFFLSCCAAGNQVPRWPAAVLTSGTIAARSCAQGLHFMQPDPSGIVTKGGTAQARELQGKSSESAPETTLYNKPSKSIAIPQHLFTRNACSAILI